MPTNYRQQILKFLQQHPRLLLVCKTFYRAYQENIFTSASSLTFSSTIALVPLVTVILSIFSAFPAFEKMQHALQDWLLHNLIPENIGEQVLEYTNQFAQHASSLGAISGIFLLISSLMLISTIEEAFNKIWHISLPRRFSQRLLLYWCGITLFPILLALGISISSYVGYLTSDWFSAHPAKALVTLAHISEALLLALASTIIFYFLPAAKVKFSHACIGGMLVSITVTLVKKLWVIYYAMVPTYSLVYGTFVIIPLLLLWIYVLWLIMLLTATFVSLLPDLSHNPNTLRNGTKGWKFSLACNIIAQFHHVEDSNRSIAVEELAQRLNTDNVYVRQIIISLIKIGWVGQIKNSKNESYILLINPEKTSVAPLINHFLLNQANVNNKLWQACHLEQMKLIDII